MMSIIKRHGSLILVGTILIGVVIDTSIPKISLFTGGLSSTLYLIPFLASTLIFAVGQFYLLKYVHSKIITIKRKTILSINQIVFYMQIILIGIISLIIIQMMMFNEYSSLLIKIIVWISYSAAIILFIFLGIRLLIWERLNRNITLILYSVAVFSLAATCILSMIYISTQFAKQLGDENIFPMQNVQVFIADSGNVYSDSLNVLLIISFIMTWIASVFLMNHYSKRIGRAVFWFMMVIPLVYFLIPFQNHFPNVIPIPHIFQGFHDSYPMTYSIVFTLFTASSILIGGIMFGIAFWSMSRSINNSTVKHYMLISAFGMIMFFATNQPTVLPLMSYPPFGISTISFVGLSSYLLIVGIYTSSISMSGDSELLRAVRRSLPSNSNFLGSIGGAQEIQRIQNKTITITRQLADKIDKETGIQPSLNEGDIKEYLEEILKEFDRKSPST